MRETHMRWIRIKIEIIKSKFYTTFNIKHNILKSGFDDFRCRKLLLNHSKKVIPYLILDFNKHEIFKNQSQSTG